MPCRLHERPFSDHLEPLLLDPQTCGETPFQLLKPGLQVRLPEDLYLKHTGAWDPAPTSCIRVLGMLSCSLIPGHRHELKAPFTVSRPGGLPNHFRVQAIANVPSAAFLSHARSFPFYSSLISIAFVLGKVVDVQRVFHAVILLIRTQAQG